MLGVPDEGGGPLRFGTINNTRDGFQENDKVETNGDEERVTGCPVHASGRDMRKTAELAAKLWSVPPEAIQVNDAAVARTLLRSHHVKQAGFTAESAFVLTTQKRKPVIITDGEEHRRQRAATARFFSPKVVTTRYLELMERTADELIARFRKDGRIDLSAISMELATAIAAEIVGLTETPPRKLADRLLALLGSGTQSTNKLVMLLANLRSLYYMDRFRRKDVVPAVRVRRQQRREDVLSHLIDEGYDGQEILSECLSYASAGMVTTKEFIVVAFWHLMEDEALRARFLAADDKAQTLIMEEILRLEPVIGMLARRTTEEIELPGPEKRKVPAGTLFHIDVRSANVDDEAVGQCPLGIDPDRTVAQRPGGSMFAFGDGVHRCPGHQVAMYESAVFLEKLLKVPGLAIQRKPDLGWAHPLAAFEFSDFIITCDRA